MYDKEGERLKKGGEQVKKQKDGKEREEYNSYTIRNNRIFRIQEVPVANKIYYTYIKYAMHCN